MSTNDFNRVSQFTCFGVDSRLLLFLTETYAKKNDLVPSLGFLEECKQLCMKYNLQHYLVLCRLYEVQLNKVRIVEEK